MKQALRPNSRQPCFYKIEKYNNNVIRLEN